MKQHTILALVLSLCGAACAASPTPPAVNAATVTSASAAQTPKQEAPAPAPTAARAPSEAAAGSEAAPVTDETAAAPAAPEEVAPAPTELRATPCDSAWVCVKVSLAKRKIEKRETMLVGDPAIPSTWSKTTDGRAAVAFDSFSKGEVQFSLRRKPGKKNEIVAKLEKGREIVIDRRDGSIDDFTHIGIIAAEGEDGALLVDIKYMR